uniref:RING-type domain-containing protein n=1 Tax=Amphimedon queenslandica TaxID=400682 RepID=A0A1X7U242_AMPQE
MAASSSPPGLLKLEEQLTCPVCLDHYTNPRTLPCLHSFCQQCLEGLPLDKKNETYYFSCPTCRHHTELPEEGAGIFPVAFHLNNLKEIWNSLSKKATEQAEPKEVSYNTDPQNCSEHGKPLEVYCETCPAVICCHCAIRSHADHRSTLISDCYQEHCQSLHEHLKPVKDKEESMKKILHDLSVRETEVRETGESVVRDIHEMVEEMIAVLHQSERKLTEQAKRVTDAKLKVLSEQVKEAEKRLSLLKDVENFVEQSLKTDTPQQVLRSKNQMMERMSEVTVGINVEELQPIEENDLKLIKDTIDCLKSLEHIGVVSYNALLEAKVKILDIVHDKCISFSLSMEAPDSSLLSVPLSSLKCSLVPVGKDEQPTHTTVTTGTDPGVYRIQCSPSTRGPHIVRVQVYEAQFYDTAQVAIPINPYLDSITQVHTMAGLNCPWGVAITDDNHVMITEFSGHCLKVISKKGEVVKLLGGKGGIGNVKFSRPRGVAITPDKFILVSDNHRIQKISMDGDCIASFGEEGSGQQQFNIPDGLSISPTTGQVYIADCVNDRIQVLNPDLTFSHSFGSKGSGNGHFNEPRDLAIDSQGSIYVADRNNCIQKFTQDGKFVGQFGTKGSGPGQLDMPYGITIDTEGTGLVYVSEYGNHRISVFTSDGVFVTSFGRRGRNIDQFNGPVGLSFDKDGFLYINDAFNNRVVVY